MSDSRKAVVLLSGGMDSCVSAAIAPTSSSVARPSQIRISMVPRLGTGRMSQRISERVSITPVVNMSWT